MKKTLLSFVAVASITVAMSGQKTSAQEITVKKGDTLWGISQKYDTSVDNIKKLNGLDSDTIIENTQLVVKKETPTYKVKKGDSLWKISKEKNVSIKDLRSWNQLNSVVIHPGQVLKLAGDGQAPVANTNKNTTAAKPAAKPAVKQTAQPTAKKAPAVQKTAAAEAKPSAGKTITVSATAYTANCNGCSGTTATGVNLKANPDAKVIAVDPNVIPLGSKVYVEGYGYATASDTGGAIKGNKIDVFIPSHDAAMSWGRKTVKVQVLN